MSDRSDVPAGCFDFYPLKYLHQCFRFLAVDNDNAKRPIFMSHPFISLQQRVC